MSAQSVNISHSQSHVNWQQIKQLYLLSKNVPTAPQPDVSSAYAELIERRTYLEVEALIRPALLQIETNHLKQIEQIEEHYKEILQGLALRIGELQKVLGRIVERQQLIKRQLRHQQWINSQKENELSVHKGSHIKKKSLIHIEDEEQEESLLEDVEQPHSVSPKPITNQDETGLYASPSQHTDFMLSANPSNFSLSPPAGQTSNEKEENRLQTKESSLQLSYSHRIEHRIDFIHQAYSHKVKPTLPLTSPTSSRQREEPYLQGSEQLNQLLYRYRKRLQETQNELSEVKNILFEAIEDTL